jgi:serine/threonine-protein kinase
MEAYDPVTARARREVAIMGECESDHLVKLGPLPLSSIEVAGQNIIYFTEEWIIGEELTTIIRQNGRLSLNKVVTLGLSVADAIDCLWSKGHVHRDVKPGNIMERSSDGEFVLLDMGFAFDVSAESISAPGAIPGTMIYFSPEQADVGRKRQLDFRSDLFALGLVMYEALTGSHPFTSGATSSLDVLSRILTVRATPPSSQSSGVSKALDEVILRLLAKAPHLRYRSCAQLMETIRAAQEGQ